MRTARFTPATALLLAAACGNSEPVMLGSVHLESAELTAAGGVLEVTRAEHAALGGTRLVVPEGALFGAVTVTIDAGPASIMDADADPSGPAVDFGPDGQAFLKPVTITVPFTGAIDEDLVRVYVKSASGEVAVLLPDELSWDAAAGTLTFEAQHFTIFQVARARDACRHVRCPLGQCRRGRCVSGVCNPDQCGPRLGLPNTTCWDGTTGGPTGRCLRNADGTCGWEVRQCPPEPDRCATARCAQGTACDPATGGCVPACTRTGCPEGQTCDATTNVCGTTPNPCATIRCRQGYACDPAAGGCVPACSRTGCPPDEVCDPATETCHENLCAAVRCRSGFTCDPATGQCNPTANTCGANTCGAGQYCCNRSCGVCAAVGAACTQQVCTGQWYLTCGDPVCRGHTTHPGVPACTRAQMEGQACTTLGDTCDPGDGCNALLVCATSDPRMQPGGCPISQREAKSGIRYLTPSELEQSARELLGIELATYTYQDDPKATKRLGFIIDEQRPGSFAVLPNGKQVDVYGYASMATAALKVQARQIAELEAQLAELREEVRAIQRAAKKR